MRGSVPGGALGLVAFFGWSIFQSLRERLGGPPDEATARPTATRAAHTHRDDLSLPPVDVMMPPINVRNEAGRGRLWMN